MNIRKMDYIYFFAGETDEKGEKEVLKKIFNNVFRLNTKEEDIDYDKFIKNTVNNEITK